MTEPVRIAHIPSHDARLGRHIHHDPASRGFARPTTVDKSTWRTRRNRIYDPRPNPDQTIGNCTMCAKAMQLNAAGNRRAGVILDMQWAVDGYVWETANDNFPGYYKPGDPQSQDTGSSGLWSAKTAQHTGDGGAYYWLFGGADEVVQAIVEGDVVSIGTEWDYDMFQIDDRGFIHPGGGVAGGHQYVGRGYIAELDAIEIRCWWGDKFRDALFARTDLDAKLHNSGDVHVQERTPTSSTRSTR